MLFDNFENIKFENYTLFRHISMKLQKATLCRSKRSDKVSPNFSPQQSLYAKVVGLR